MFKSLLALIDKRVIRSLMTERCKDAPGGLTPLGYWLVKPSIYYGGRCRYGEERDQSRLSPEIFDVLMAFGGEEAVGMMDSSGQFPLHVAVKNSYVDMVKKLIAYDPALLSRENAMGQTSLELAHTMYLQDCTKGIPNVRASDHTPLETRAPEEFIEDREAYKRARTRRAWYDGYSEDDWDNDIVRTYRLCNQTAKEHPRDRKLVSVNEAREVAKRLAAQKKREREACEEAEEEPEPEAERGEMKAEGRERKAEGDVLTLGNWMPSYLCDLE